MLLFSLEKFNYLARPLLRAPKLEIGIFKMRRFSNNELFLTVKNKVDGQKCYALGTFAPPDENLLKLLLLSHTLKKEGAREVIAVVPYLGYGRQDKADEMESLGLAWMGNLLAASGIDKIITVDLHNPRSVPLLKTPVIFLKSNVLFASAILKDKIKFDSILAPDEGALERCGELGKALNFTDQIVYCRKTRGPEGVSVSGIIGKLRGPRILIHDDILDTGGTLIAACQAARRAGAEEIIIAVTHGVFTGAKWNQLWKLGVRKIYTTNSLPSAMTQKSKKIKIVSLNSLLSDYLTVE
ncbi:MAG: ribose-phosphate pyrophosphokinase [Candidatus Magasanikbacteria bacterium]|nr:ribose-phosphate pyrophosphokinase [Candidatus Magasanikbacteria bacterium]